MTQKMAYRESGQLTGQNWYTTGIRKDRKMINWISFPKNKRPPESFMDIVDVFEKVKDDVDSEKHNKNSNEVLAVVKPGLEGLGYEVEKGKKKEDKIHIPVLFGEKGAEEKAFEADAYNTVLHTIVEVEAGRAVVNYQFLKDFYEACMMHDVDYLCIAVRNVYRASADYEKVKTFFETMYLSERVRISLKGILVIGY